MNQGTNLGSQIGRWIILAALVALLGALLLTIQPVRAQEAPPEIRDAETVFDHNENDTGAITTYRATDPEGNKIFWTLGGLDAADFTIAGGTLRFKGTPNYEVPTDRARGAVTADLTARPPVLAAAAELPMNNTYKVTVRTSAGGEDGYPDPLDDYDGDDVAELELTINVINVDEAGGVSISSLQPQVGTKLTATVADLDGVTIVGSWQWASSDSANGTFTNIPAKSADNTYRPTIDDLDKYLRVTAIYKDSVSGTATRERSAISPYPVRKDIVSSNDSPTFPDQTTLGVDTAIDADGASLLPERTETERFILENSPAGTLVGAPVEAFDDATEIEVLTYSLSDTTPNTGHAGKFVIDPATGQIAVNVRAGLNADVDAEELGGADMPYEVTVTAIDGDGDTQTIAVLIRVVGVNEPPRIHRDYATDRTPNDDAIGDRAPTEISHYELDRENSPATELDTDLETLRVPASRLEDATAGLEPATYFAMDPDGDTIAWSVDGPDADKFVINDTNEGLDGIQNTGLEATFAFRPEKVAGKPDFVPDFEKPGDADKDNVYEVTLVVTDSVGQRGEYDVTVKVINSTDDNKPGKVTILNRHPEVATALQAEFMDPDRPTNGTVNWQWYRSILSSNDETRPCVAYDPHTDPATAAEAVRYFIDSSDQTVWEMISGATKDTYTPGYDQDSGGIGSSDTETPEIVVWTGGDIGVTVTTTNGVEVYTAWTAPQCLRATVTYRDGVDRTHSDQDSNPNDAVDETLEATFKGSEFPVKRIDEQNNAPVFTDTGSSTGNVVSRYTALRGEDATHTSTPDSILITEALSASDLFDEVDNEEDDVAPDTLTYSLSGADADHFVIVGSVDYPLSYDPDDDDTNNNSFTGAGSLIITDDLDYESQTKYKVKVTATDPSGDKNFVEVTVNIKDINEPPEWVTDAPNSPTTVVYAENGTANVGTYLAENPDFGKSVSYSLVDDPADILTDNIDDAEATLLIADRNLFAIDKLHGHLIFKSSPNYEEPRDGLNTVGAPTPATNNMYQIAVKATSVDSPELTPPHMETRIVTVVVTNVNEAPVFSKTTGTLEISENPDDPEKEPPLAAGYLYLLNRGVGKPSENLPAAPNLDVGIPVRAADGDNTGIFAIGGHTETPAITDRVDGLTYELSGADAASFHIIKATGQILTKVKLDYETEREYNVTVIATDPYDLSGSIPLTIAVRDVDEVPISTPTGITISGQSGSSYAENGTSAVETYTAHGENAASVVWTLEGADSGDFSIDRSGESSMLKFRSSPNFEAPTDADTDNIYMVTVKASVGGFADTQDVSVTVTNVSELGALEGMASISYAENGTGAVGTYTISGENAAMATWTLDGDDSEAFSIGGSGASSTLTFRSVPDYEAPTDADTDNIYMVSVTVEVGGEMDTHDVIVTVTNVSELGTLEGVASITYAEGGTDTVGTYFVPGGGSATWTLEGADSGVFNIDDSGASRMLSFKSAPDYEAPADADTNNTYMVTIRIDGGGEMANLDITVIVTNEEEGGSVVLSLTSPAVDDAVTAVLTDPDGSITNVIWLWETSQDMVTWSTATGAVTTVGALSIYTIVEDDVDDYLRATASYEDGHDASNSAVSQLAMVVATRVNVAPTFPNEAETRNIAENTAANTNIGDPVEATDGNGDTLEYSLSGTDAVSFSIGLNTGQLQTLAPLNYETKNTYNVVVTATDPDGESDTTAVTINVTDVVEEAPAIPAIVDDYDSDNSGKIEIDELFKAIDDYFDVDIELSIDDLFAVIDAYFREG